MAIEPTSILSIADMLERGLSGDAASLRDVVEASVAELRALIIHVNEIVLRDGVANPQELLRRDDTHFNFAVASAIKTGKTFLVAAIARAMLDANRIEKIIIFTGGDPNDTVEQFSICGDAVVVFPYTAEYIETWVSNREKRKADGKSLSPTLVIFDDIVGMGVEKNSAVMNLFTRGRHLNVWTCVSSQQSNNALAPTFKANSRFIIFSQLTGSAMNTLHKDLVLRPELSPSRFRALIAEKCEDYVFALYDAHAKAITFIRA
jgi:hypothetical protein